METAPIRAKEHMWELFGRLVSDKMADAGLLGTSWDQSEEPVVTVSVSFFLALPRSFLLILKEFESETTVRSSY